mgnify:FL=1
MGKINNRKSFIIIGAVVLCIVIAYLISLSLREKTVIAYITPSDIEVGDAIQYTDSTKRADMWLWEFGNGDTSEERTGSYRFTQSGKYQVRLTVDRKYEKKFIVNVREKNNDKTDEELIKIEAPDFALQDEIISFHGIGDSKEWRWQFGETGMVDSREKNPLYANMDHCAHEMKVITAATHYPIRHTIQIEPNYQKNDSTDVLTLVGNDIRERLQAIVDGKPFNLNYNYVLNTYLCDNPDVVVTVNGDKHNDFYSYCQGLKIIGRKKLIIEEVVVDIGNSNTDECIKKLLVTQSEKYISK